MNWLIFIGGVIIIGLASVYLLASSYAFVLLSNILRLFPMKALGSLAAIRVAGDATLEEINEMLESLGVPPIKLTKKEKKDENNMMYR